MHEARPANRVLSPGVPRQHLTSPIQRAPVSIDTLRAVVARFPFSPSNHPLVDKYKPRGICITPWHIMIASAEQTHCPDGLLCSSPSHRPKPAMCKRAPAKEICAMSDEEQRRILYQQSKSVQYLMSPITRPEAEN